MRKVIVSGVWLQGKQGKKGYFCHIIFNNLLDYYFQLNIEAKIQGR